jgi:hypothetical protein
MTTVTGIMSTNAGVAFHNTGIVSSSISAVTAVPTSSITSFPTLSSRDFAPTMMFHCANKLVLDSTAMWI